MPYPTNHALLPEQLPDVDFEFYDYDANRDRKNIHQNKALGIDHFTSYDTYWSPHNKHNRVWACRTPAKQEGSGGVIRFQPTPCRAITLHPYRGKRSPINRDLGQRR